MATLVRNVRIYVTDSMAYRMIGLTGIAYGMQHLAIQCIVRVTVIKYLLSAFLCIQA